MRSILVTTGFILGRSKMKYAIIGAGAIGGYIGARLAQQGSQVVLIGRGSLAKAVNEAGGITVQKPFGSPEKVAITMTEDLSSLSNIDAALIAVRSVDSFKTAEAIKPYLPSKAVVFSMQNGVSNPKILASVLGEDRVAAGMVTFNVVIDGANFQQTINGPIVVGRPALNPSMGDELASDCRAAGLDAKCVSDMLPVSWGKLLLNLGNSVGALSNLPILSFVSDPDGRAILAAAIEEGLRVLKRANIQPAKAGLLGPDIVLKILRIPIPKKIAPPLLKRMYKLTPDARSSTWRDLQNGKQTEIDFLNGEVVALAKQVGEPAPVNETLVRLVKEAEEKHEAPSYPLAELRRLISSPR
jgi:2-dehydropantoate 2-reductase